MAFDGFISLASFSAVSEGLGEYLLGLEFSMDLEEVVIQLGHTF